MASNIEALTGLEYIRFAILFASDFESGWRAKSRPPPASNMFGLCCLFAKKFFDNPPTTTATHQGLLLMGNPPRELPMGCPMGASPRSIFDRFRPKNILLKNLQIDLPAAS